MPILERWSRLLFLVSLRCRRKFVRWPENKTLTEEATLAGNCVTRNTMRIAGLFSKTGAGLGVGDYRHARADTGTRRKEPASSRRGTSVRITIPLPSSFGAIGKGDKDGLSSPEREPSVRYE